MSFGDEMIAGMKRFVQALKSGEPIEVIEVRREETPDGPLHTRTKKEMRYIYGKARNQSRGDVKNDSSPCS